MRGPGRARSTAVAGALAAALTVVLVAGAVRAPEVDARTAELRRDLAWIVRAPGWSSARWGVLAVSLDTRDTLFAMDADRSLVPASNMKLLTTAAALHYLGRDFRFTTWLLADGPVVDGRLEGDLLLYGTGDPGISDRLHESRGHVWEELARQLREAGIHAVDGDVVGDASYFQGPLFGPEWDRRDLSDWFAAPAGALSYNENVVTLRIEPGPWSGAPPRVHTVPEGAVISMLNRARTGPGRLAVYREEPERPIQVTGALPSGSRDIWRRLTVSDPARFATHAFVQAMDEAGVELRGAVRTTGSEDRSRISGVKVWGPPGTAGGAPRVVARFASPPLVDYLEVVNKESHNFFAEMILKTLGRVVEGEGSFRAGARVMERFLHEKVGAPAGSFHLRDGSGLSPTNRVTPGTLVALLSHVAGSSEWDAFWSTLPEAGNHRELGRMYRTAAARNLRAKTGTIEGVSALSGVVRTANGERIAFSILGNDLPSVWAAKSRVEDRIGARLASFRRPFTPAESEPPVVAPPGTSSTPTGAGGR